MMVATRTLTSTVLGELDRVFHLSKPDTELPLPQAFCPSWAAAI